MATRRDGRPLTTAAPTGPVVGGSFDAPPAPPATDLGVARGRATTLATVGFRVARTPTARRADLVLAAGDAALEGTADAHRERELLELPLVAGAYLDDDVLTALTLGADVHDRSAYGAGRVLEPRAMADGPTPLPSAGPFGPGTGTLFAGGGYLTAPQAALQVADRDFTVSLWVRAGRVERTMTLLDTRAQATTTAGLSVNLLEGTGSAALVLADGGGVCGQHVTAPRIDDDTWHHVAFVRRGDRLWGVIDGRVAGAATSIQGACDVSPADEGLVLGARGADAGIDPLEGRLADVVLGLRPLSPLALRALAAARQPWGAPLLPGAQPDVDDLQVFEDGRAIPFAVVGARPAGDAPADVDPLTTLYLPLGAERAAWGLGAGEQLAVSGDPSPTLGRFGDAEGALSLFLDDHVEVAEDRGWRLGERFTLEIWVRGGTAATDQALLVGYTRAGLRPDAGAGLLLTADGRPRFVGAVATPTHPDGVVLDGPDPISADHWHHVAGVREGARFTLYVDGLPVATAEDASVPADFDGGGPWQLGAVRRGPADFEQRLNLGALDDAVVRLEASSADAVFARAHPLPRLRFFVRTRPTPDGAPAYPTYTLAWSNPRAWPAPTRDADLLGPANGVVGWWRPDAWPPHVIDISNGRRHGTFAGPSDGALGHHADLGAVWSVEPDGACLEVAETRRPVPLAPATLEATVAVTGPLPGTTQPAVSVGAFGADPVSEIGFDDARFVGRVGGTTAAVEGPTQDVRHVALVEDSVDRTAIFRLVVDRDDAGAATATQSPVAEPAAPPLFVGCRAGVGDPVGLSPLAIGGVRLSEGALTPATLLPAEPTRLVRWPASP